MARNSTRRVAGRGDRGQITLWLGAALLAAASCSTTTPPSSKTSSPSAVEPTTDAATAARVKAALAGDPRLAGRQIEVTVKGGVAHLSGVVESNHDLFVVEGDVQSVPGVTSVDEEQLVIQRGGTPP